MEELEERRVWQRVRGTDRTQELRDCLVRQGKLRGAYRQLARRGGRGLRLLEQKENQIACLRGLLRVRTGQSVAPPRSGDGPVDLLECFQAEQRFLEELIRWSREEELGPVFAALAEGQKRQCRILLELLGTA